MKHLFVILFCLSLSFSIHAQDTKIQFLHQDWETTLKKASEENKLIFIDCYTDWCGPCKWMAANVFTDSEVAKYYNDNFINVKIDMEKGEGILFRKAYEVNAFPTLLFVDSYGHMVHKAIGSRPVNDFLDLGHAASDSTRQIGSILSLYDDGNRDPDFLKKGAIILQDGSMPEAENMATEYLASQDNWSTEENREFILSIAKPDIESKLFQHISSNRNDYYQQFGQGRIDNYLKYAINPKIRKIKNPSLTQLTEIYSTIFPDKADEYAELHQLNSWMYSKDEQNQANFLRQAPIVLNKYDVQNSNSLNSFAWRVFELSDNKETLTAALGWAKKSVSIESSYFNNDTVAALYYKLKDKKNAIDYAEKAIALAKAQNSDFSSTEKLLSDINKLK